MVKYKKFPRKKKIYARKKKVSSNLRKAIKSVVKKQIETKEYDITDGNFNLPQNDCYILNPLYNLGYGTAFNNRIGTKINIQRIEIRGIVSNGTVTALNSFYPGFCYIWFFRAPVIQVGSVFNNWSLISATNFGILFDTAVSTPCNMLRINKQRGVQLLGMKRIYWTPNSGPSTAGAFATSKPFSMAVNMKNHSFDFEEANTGFQTKWNYYFVAQSFTQNAATSVETSCNLRWNAKIWYKDA